MAMIGLLTVLLAVSVIKAPSYKSIVSLGEGNGGPSGLPIDIKAAEAKAYDGYADVFRSREIFKLPHRSMTANSPRRTETNEVDLAAGFPLDQQFRLVGVVIDDAPQAVIEDMVRKKTIFLQIGDVVDGMQLMHVERGKIIVEADGKKFEIKPQ